MNLKLQTFSAVRWTTLSSICKAILQIVQISILARLLSPTDFGLVALVSSLMSFLQIFADAGISNAIIHQQNISQKQLASLYWLNIGVSTFLALVLSLFAPLISGWYHQPNMTSLLLLSAITLLVTAIAQQLRVMAQKNLRFAILAKIELCSSVVGFIVSIGSVLNGAGVFSIIFGSLSNAAVGSLLVWHYLSDGWRPQLRLNFREISHFLSFGAYMIGNNLANTFNSQIDIMLGTKILGPQEIGLYSLPRDLNLRIAGVINPIVTNVGMPVMAKAQSDKLLLQRVYLQTMRMTASINFPIYVSMIFFSSDIVHALFGNKWESVVPLLRVFSIWGLVRSTGNPVGSLLVACGRADLSFKWNLMLLILLPPIIYVSSTFGVLVMAISMTSLITLLYWPNWYFQVNPLCGATFSEYSYQIAIPLILSLISFSAAYLIANFFYNEIVRLLFCGAVGFSIYLGLSLRFNCLWTDSMWELLLGKNRNMKNLGM